MGIKSHVSLEQRICSVCGGAFDTGAILLDSRLRPTMEYKTVTGYGLCENCDKQHREGFLALVEKSGALRTGRIAHLRREAAGQIFTGITDEQLQAPMVYVDSEVIDDLQKMYGEVEGE